MSISALPEPLTKIECDLRDFPFMPVDIVRLFNSGFHARASDAEWRAGMTLWLKSYHQVPAASIPDDDIALARLAEFGKDVKGWKKVREKALYGWIKCSDGRLYHPVVAEKAAEAWSRKQAFRDRTQKARQARLSQREKPQSSVTDDATDSATDSTGTGDSGEGQISTSQPCARQAFRMLAGWKPSAHFPTLAKQAGITATPDGIAEFTAYWLTREETERTQAEWDKALLQSLKHSKLAAASKPPRGEQATPPRAEQRRNIHHERAETIAGLTGRNRNAESRTPIDITPE